MQLWNKIKCTQKEIKQKIIQVKMKQHNKNIKSNLNKMHTKTINKKVNIKKKKN